MMIFKAHHLSVGSSIQTGLITVTVTNLSEFPLEQVVLYPIFPGIRLLTSIQSLQLNPYEMQTFVFIYSADTTTTGKLYAFYSQKDEKDGLYCFESETMTLYHSTIQDITELEHYIYLLSFMRETHIDLSHLSPNSHPRAIFLFNRLGLNLIPLLDTRTKAWICFDPVLIIQQPSQTSLSLHSFDHEFLNRLKRQIEAQSLQKDAQKTHLFFKLGQLLTTLDDLFAIDCDTDEAIKILNKIRQISALIGLPFQFAPILSQIQHTKTLGDLPMTDKNSCVTMIDQFMLEMEL
jgi:hypothetical protein